MASKWPATHIYIYNDIEEMIYCLIPIPWSSIWADFRWVTLGLGLLLSPDPTRGSQELCTSWRGNQGAPVLRSMHI